MGRGRGGLRLGIAMTIAAAGLVSVIAVVGYLRHTLAHQALDQWDQEGRRTAAILAEGFDRAIDEMVADLTFVAGRKVMGGLPDRHRVDRALNGIPADADPDKRKLLSDLMADGRFSVLFVLQPNGDHYLSHPFKVQKALQRFSLADRPYVMEAERTGRPVVSDAFAGADGIPAVAIDVPRVTEDGELVLHLGGVIHLPRLTEIFSATVRRPFDLGMLVDRRGTVLAAAGTGHGIGSPDPALTQALRDFQNGAPAEGRAVSRTYLDPARGEEVHAAFVRLRNGWAMALARPQGEFAADVAPRVWRISVTVGSLLLLIYALAYAGAHHLVRGWEEARRALANAHDELEERVRDRTADLDSSRRELDAKSRTLENILDHIDQGVSVYDERLRLVACNRRFVELLHLPPDMARPGIPLEDCLRFNARRGEYGPGDPEALVTERMDLARAFRPHRFQRVRSDGTALEIIGTPLPGGGFVTTHTDITEARKAEESLRTLSRAVEQSPVSVVITDPMGNIDYVNPKFEEICGYTLDEVKGLNPRFLKSGNTPESDYAELWATISAGGTWEGDLQNRKKNGELFWERASISPIRGPNGEVLHYIGVKEDITARKAAEIALMQALQSAREADRAKTVFLSHMSHELRTPLTAVLGYTEMLEAEPAGPLDPMYRDFVKAIATGGRHLLSVIDDVLDISRIELGSYRVTMAPADLTALARDCVDMLRPQCVAKDIVLDLRDEGPMPVNTDAKAVRQIFVNLLGNAVKYTEAGGRIEVTLSRDRHGAKIVVADTGCGIPADKLAHIFEPFQRVDPLRADPARGVGLGLAICRRIADLLEGGIAIRSEPGRGTCVTVTLPAPP